MAIQPRQQNNQANQVNKDKVQEKDKAKQKPESGKASQQQPKKERYESSYDDSDEL